MFFFKHLPANQQRLLQILLRKVVIMQPTCNIQASPFKKSDLKEFGINYRHNRGIYRHDVVIYNITHRLTSKTKNLVIIYQVVSASVVEDMAETQYRIICNKPIKAMPGLNNEIIDTHVPAHIKSTKKTNLYIDEKLVQHPRC